MSHPDMIVPSLTVNSIGGGTTCRVRIKLAQGLKAGIWSCDDLSDETADHDYIPFCDYYA